MGSAQAKHVQPHSGVRGLRATEGCVRVHGHTTGNVVGMRALVAWQQRIGTRGWHTLVPCGVMSDGNVVGSRARCTVPVGHRPNRTFVTVEEEDAEEDTEKDADDAGYPPEAGDRAEEEHVRIRRARP